MSELRLSDLCRIFSANGLDARLEGDDRLVRAVNTLEEAGDGEVSFLSNPKYISALSRTKASAVLVKDGMDVPPGLSVIRCADPYAAETVSITASQAHR